MDLLVNSVIRLKVLSQLFTQNEHHVMVVALSKTTNITGKCQRQGPVLFPSQFSVSSLFLDICEVVALIKILISASELDIYRLCPPPRHARRLCVNCFNFTLSLPPTRLPRSLSYPGRHLLAAQRR